MSMISLPSSITIRLDARRSYDVSFRPLEALPDLMAQVGLRRGRCLVVTDEQVAVHYLSLLDDALQKAGWTPYVVALPPGEATKAPAHLQTIYDAALRWGIDRKTPMVALGGGVVGDLAGFAAATLLRGLPLVQVPTTLIAQVDSALGGKTGYNHAMGKNLIGAFHQPRLVCVDLRTLATLPAREWTSGLAEVIKHALIADAGFVDLLEARWDHVLARDPTTLSDMVSRAAAIKAAIVQDDEREQGARALLNFGHTFGHAIERTAGYGVFTHGEAVALGMQAALFLSHHYAPAVPLARAAQLVRRIPVAGSLAALSTSALMDAMQTDKKVEGGRLRLVLLRRLGEAYVADNVSSGLIETAWNFAKQTG